MKLTWRSTLAYETSEILLYLQTDKLAYWCHACWQKTQGCWIKDKGIIYNNNNSSIIIFVQVRGHQFSQGDTKTRDACIPTGAFDRRGTTRLGNPNLFNSLTSVLEKDIIFIVLDSKQACPFLWIDKYLSLSRLLKRYIRTKAVSAYCQTSKNARGLWIIVI